MKFELGRSQWFRLALLVLMAACAFVLIKACERKFHIKNTEQIQVEEFAEMINADEELSEEEKKLNIDEFKEILPDLNDQKS